MNEIKDLLECIAKFDKTENLETKGRYFETIQKDAERLVKLFAIPDVVFSEAEVCQLKQAEYERGVEDGKIIAEHGTVNWQT